VRDTRDVGPGRAPDADDDQSFALEGPLGGLVAALRAPADLGPGVDAAVMAAVRLAPPLAVVPGGAATVPTVRTVAVRGAPAAGRRSNAFVRGARWLARPRPVRVSPLGALAAAGIALAAVLGLRRDAPRRGDVGATGEFPIAATGEYPVPAAAARTRDTVFVTRFVLVAPGAKQVALVGDFNDWDRGATPLVQVAQGGQGGVWTVELPLQAGRYAYAFLVDGNRWTADPSAPPAVGDDFGRPSSVVTVRGA
jgi:hypothetical protein